MAVILPKIAEAWSNPVVVRDLRMRLRSPKAFWSQAFYLGLLISLALGGYLAATGFNRAMGSDPVMIQRSLQAFYYFIFETLAALISLIAPALTAVAIISERQRLTLDLLVASPMTAMKMLTGKLISSIAFLLLLLLMSIPASALCVILGGATIADVLRIYALFAIDGVVLAAIGLAFSCTSRQNIQAIIGTYGAIVLLYIGCFMVSMTTMTSMYRSGLVGGVATVPGIAAIGMLCPFIAAASPSVAVQFFGVSVPLWLAVVCAGAIFVRLVLTAAALRLGMYGPGLVGSLRRQILLAEALVLYLVGSAITQSLPSSDGNTSFAIMIVVSTIALFIALFFLPTLFVPSVDEDAPAGQVVRGAYNIRTVFRGDHSGSLPFYHILLVVGVAALAIGLALPLASSTGFSMPAHGSHGSSAMSPHRAILVASLCALWYFSGLGFLMWSLARRSATFVASAAAARPVTFLIFAFLVIVPLPAMLITEQISPQFIAWDHMWISHLWLLYPSIGLVEGLGGAGRVSWAPFAQTGLLAYALGIVAYPFWKPVTPAYGMREQRKTAQKGVA